LLSRFFDTIHTTDAPTEAVLDALDEERKAEKLKLTCPTEDAEDGTVVQTPTSALAEEQRSVKAGLDMGAAVVCKVAGAAQGSLSDISSRALVLDPSPASQRKDKGQPSTGQESGSMDDILLDMDKWLEAAEKVKSATLQAAGQQHSSPSAASDFPDKIGDQPYQDPYQRGVKEAMYWREQEAAGKKEGDDGPQPWEEGEDKNNTNLKISKRPMPVWEDPKKGLVMGSTSIHWELQNTWGAPEYSSRNNQDSLMIARDVVLAHSWQSWFGLLGPDAEEGEEPRVRVLISMSSPSIMLVELNAVASFNMLDPVMNYNFDQAMDTRNLIMKRSPMHKNYPLACVFQGSGPHFCPGGNHHPVSPPGGTAWSMNINVGSLNPMRWREVAMPTILAYTGSNIGGGIAIGLQHTHRIGAANMSAAFGNISRGACPVMMLSRNLPLTVGLANAVNIYLTDTTVSACSAERTGLIYQVSPTFAAVKNHAYLIAKYWASAPGDLRSVVRAWKEYEFGHFRREGKGMTIAMSTGKMFANVKSARSKKTDASTELEASKAPPTLPEQGRSVHIARAANTSRPIPVAGSDAACGQCGDQNVDGVFYGASLFCD